MASKTLLVGDGQIVGDGSWVLNILVTDLNLERKFRVRGDMHVGGVMLRLVEDLDITRDWSDHALWWPKKNRWLLHTRSTLDQCGVGSESVLYFTPMHKIARVQLPDLQFITARIDFSIPVFNAAVQLCRELGVRYPEELSFKRYIDPETLKKMASGERRESLPPPKKGRGEREGSAGPQHTSQSAYDISSPTQPQHLPTDASLHSINGARGSPVTPSHTNSTWPPRIGNVGGQYSTLQLNSSGRVSSPVGASFTWDGAPDFDQSLTVSPRNPPKETVEMMLRPKNLAQKANLNRGWLDSSRSLMEQGIYENDLILLRFKFLQFFDLNPKYDPVRINQIYEQAKWSLLMEEIDVTDEEMLMFAALQLQVTRQTTNPSAENQNGVEDDVEAALDDLECTLEGVSLSKYNDITNVPELADYLKYLKPKKLTLKGWKRCYFTFKDLYVSYYRSPTESHGAPMGRICLKGCEVSPDVNLSQQKFGIKLLIPSSDGMSEFWIRCDSEQQYAKWMAGCKLAARGKSMADAGYPAEVEQIRRLLDMQHPAPSQAIQGPLSDINPEEFVNRRFLKKYKIRSQAIQRIMEAHANVKELAAVDAKLQYIRAWQAVPENGMHYFVVKFINYNSRKPELLAVCCNRLVRMNLDTGDSIKTWSFNSMNRWHVNWEIKHVLVQFEEENIEFSCLSADCKVPHEFIGGYIFASMRSKDQNQVLNDELFHKLTGGWA